MKPFQDLVTDFHVKFKRSVGKFIGDNFDNEKERKLRAALVLEEACEFVEACGFEPLDLFHATPNILASQRGDGLLADQLRPIEPNFPEAVDALADLLYVTFGSAVTFGVSMTTPFIHVHRSNLTKTGGGIREDGKILKGPDFKPTNMPGTLEAMGWKRAG